MGQDAAGYPGVELKEIRAGMAHSAIHCRKAYCALRVIARGEKEEWEQVVFDTWFHAHPLWQNRTTERIFRTSSP